MLVTTLDVLYIALSVGFLVLVGYVSYMSYKLAKTLELLQPLLRDAKDVTDDIKTVADDVRKVKDNVTTGIGAITALIQAFSNNKKEGK